jgi:hypothetical protein
METWTLMAFPGLVFQTRDETMRAFTQISELVSSQIVPEKQVK